nr:hypothetical protein [Desulfobulbaceae bacterium]
MIFQDPRDGNSNSAYNFDGNDYIRVQDNDLLELTNVGTVSAWFQLTSDKGDPNNGIVGKYRSDSLSQEGYAMYADQLTDENQLRGWTRINGNGSTAPFYYINGFDQWINVTMTFNENYYTDLYVNGQYYGTGNAPAGSTVQNTSNPLVIGAGMGANGAIYNYFSGSIDDVYLYDRALSSAEINSLYTGASTVPKPATMLIFCTGLAGLVGSRIRR